MAEQAKAFGDKAMSRAQVYDIVKKAKNGENMEDNRGKAVNKFVRTEEMINDVKRSEEHTRVNANYIVDTLNRFLNRFQRKRPELWAQKNWWFHWDNASVHTAAVVTEHLAAKAFKVIRHPPYSPDLAPADFFLFPKVKNALAGVHLDDGELKKAWDGVTATIAAADWMAAFNAWVRRCNKCIDVAGNFVEK